MIFPEVTVRSSADGTLPAGLMLVFVQLGEQDTAPATYDRSSP
jgi:hypothetical protein